MEQPKTFIFFGRSGSGKGTQARLLLKHLQESTDRKVLYIETGSQFREFMTGSGFTNKLTKETIERGELLPEFLPIWTWADYLIKNFTGEEHLILDGLARHLDESYVLDSALRFYKRERPFVLHLDVPREYAFALMKGRGRKDDTDTYINNRLDWFEKEVVPALDYFKQNPNYTFIEIPGKQDIEDVHQEIIRQTTKQ
ncbi:MAG: nucleoside monophosphate kinase [Patescibacteria group bacterium]